MRGVHSFSYYPVSLVHLVCAVTTGTARVCVCAHAHLCAALGEGEGDGKAEAKEYSSRIRCHIFTLEELEV